MERNVVEFLKNASCRFPNKTACADETDCLSYRELWETSHEIAFHLLEMVSIGTPIPVFMKKSCGMLKIIWGIIKAGGCYVVIDPGLPKERIQSILNTVETDLVIGDSESRTKLGENIRVFTPQEFTGCITDSQCKLVDDRISQVCDIDPLYIAFTSGSTGVPKGITANHRSVIDFITCFTDLFRIDDQDVIGNQAPWDFDVSVKDIFSAAKAGAQIQIIPKKLFSFPTQLADYLTERKVTTLIWAVSALCILSSKGVLEKNRPESIGKVIFSGEVMPVKQFNIWKSSYPKALFANVYGPTEITCNCTYFVTDRLYELEESIPIGQAFPNERVFLLDENDARITPSEPGRMGEICVSGTAVTMGYYNNSEATRRSFVQNPLNTRYSEIIYRTGDLGFYNSEMQLCFSCRKDFQIKHMGHRIELSEIERAVSGIPAVGLCCCIYHNETICAFYEGNVGAKEIVRAVKKTLPSFMVPEKIVQMDKLPINKNGKIDRKKLTEDLGI